METLTINWFAEKIKSFPHHLQKHKKYETLME